MAWIVWSAVVLTALGIPAFRCFLTLDGPLHVLHAAVWGDSLIGDHFHAGGLMYDKPWHRVDLVVPLLYGLVQVLTPEATETAFAVLVVFVFCGGAVRYVHAVCGEHRWAVLLILPFSFSFLLMLGFFKFLLSVGLCLWLMALWQGVERVGRRELAGAALVVLVCLALHRGAAPLLLFLGLVHEFVLLIGGGRGGWSRLKERWSVVPPRVLVIGAVTLGLVVAGYMVYLCFFRRAWAPSPERDGLYDLVRLRVLVLVDGDAERWMSALLGVLFLGALVWAVAVARRQGCEARMWTVPVAGAGLLLVSVLVDTPWTALHYLTERLQLVGLLLFVVGAATVLRNSYLSFGLAALCLIVHVGRLVFLEHRLAWFAAERNSAAEAVQHLRPGALVAAQRCTEEWLREHALAPVMTRHNGLIVGRFDQINVCEVTP